LITSSSEEAVEVQLTAVTAVLAAQAARPATAQSLSAQVLTARPSDKVEQV
jgi:hypothetical protein